jgi:hypothetical protein
VHTNVHCVEDAWPLTFFSYIRISVYSVCSVVPASVLFLIVVQGSRQISGSFNANATAELLEKAANGLPKPPPDVFMDNGIENTNSTVTAMVENGIIAREEGFSNKL